MDSDLGRGSSSTAFAPHFTMRSRISKTDEIETALHLHFNGSRIDR
jgi:hypothetical protein